MEDGAGGGGLGREWEVEWVPVSKPHRPSGMKVGMVIGLKGQAPSTVAVMDGCCLALETTPEVSAADSAEVGPLVSARSHVHGLNLLRMARRAPVGFQVLGPETFV